MNIQRLSGELKFINRMGQTLSTEEVISLQSSVLKLGHEYRYEKFSFWGRVEGTASNYYIIEGANFKGVGNFPSKKYFWSSEDFKFAELPAPRAQFATQAALLLQFFTGQHQKILIKSSTGRSVAVNGQSLQVKVKNFTQLDRLSLVVNQVNQDCQVVPLGAYKMIPTHELISSPSFTGLKMSNLTSLQNYVHLREPVQPQKKILIECDKCLERDDFLDSLDQDSIKDSWSVQTDQSKAEVTIRSLIWPGYLAYHRANSSVFGGAYFGTGIKNYDFPFSF